MGLVPPGVCAGRCDGSDVNSPELLRLRLLGACEVATHAGPVHLESAKTTALLAYLTLAPGPHPRPALTEMLWPELAGERAAAALRRALWDIRRRVTAGGDDGAVLADRRTVEINPRVAREVDVERFAAACTSAARLGEGAAEQRLDELRRGLALYRGDLLDGLEVDGAPAFEEWRSAQRERLRLAALQALRRMIAALRARGESVRALAYARRLLALDPWLEEAHRAVAELLALTGQHGAALQQLETCRRVLAQELGVSPSPRTIELERRLREPRRIAPEAGAPPPAAGVPWFPRHNLPPAATPFVGREEELERIAQHLADPACRLLTLLGPGGIGKTRLAVQAATAAIAQGGARRAVPLDRVAFVAAAGDAGGVALLDALSGALDLAPGAAGDVRDRVFALLRERRVLLLLDGFEHRIADAALLPELLAAAPELRAIATSRERLGVPGEWVMEVGGLGVPRAGAAGAAAGADAVQLFLQGARRAAVGFTADAVALAAVARVCRAVAGMPLAIELAAAWMHALSPSDLAAELDCTLDVIAAGGGPRSALNAVFEQSYGRLAESERRAVRMLSVLPGGMTRAAALAVAGARAAALRALADRSFVRFDPASGRYTMHEVLRHFAGERLARSPAELAEAHRLRRDHLAALVAEVGPAIEARGARDDLAALEAEADNLRATWRAAVAAADVEFVATAFPALAALAEAHGRYREGEALAGEALAAAAVGGGTDAARARARALVRRGGLRVRLAAFDGADADLRAALAALADGDAGERARALLHLGDAALLQGRFDEAERLLGECRELAAAAGSERVEATALARLGRAVLDRGRHAEARALFERSLAAAERIGDRQAAVHAANQLGYVEYFDGDLDAAAARFALALTQARGEDDPAAAAAALCGLAYVAEDRGELDRAGALYRESLALAQEQGDRFAAGRALMLLGEVARKRGELAEARRRYEESLAVNAALHSRFIVACLHGNLAFVACGEGRLGEAREHAAAALAEYRASGADTVALPAAVAFAEVAAAEGDDERALRLLALVLGHPGNRQDHRVECERVLAPIRARRGGEAVAAALAAPPGLDLDAVAAEALDGVAATPPGGRRRGRGRRAEPGK
jgi:predicted ATPase/DNA-binding SARP family transcriptional activator